MPDRPLTLCHSLRKLRFLTSVKIPLMMPRRMSGSPIRRACTVSGSWGKGSGESPLCVHHQTSDSRLLQCRALHTEEHVVWCSDRRRCLLSCAYTMDLLYFGASSSRPLNIAFTSKLRRVHAGNRGGPLVYEVRHSLSKRRLICASEIQAPHAHTAALLFWVASSFKRTTRRSETSRSDAGTRSSKELACLD